MAISSLTVQWVDVLETALQEIYRVLKPGGRAVITSFGPMTLQELREAFAAVDKLPHVSDFASVESMAQQAESVGFNVLNTSAEFRNQHYATVRELMQAIRAIGASNKTAGRRKTLTGRHRFPRWKRPIARPMKPRAVYLRAGKFCICCCKRTNSRGGIPHRRHRNGMW